MKPMFIEPEPSKFNFSLTDKMIEFAHNNNGHKMAHSLLAQPDLLHGCSWAKKEK